MVKCYHGGYCMKLLFGEAYWPIRKQSPCNMCIWCTQRSLLWKSSPVDPAHISLPFGADMVLYFLRETEVASWSPELGQNHYTPEQVSIWAGPNSIQIFIPEWTKKKKNNHEENSLMGRVAQQRLWISNSWSLLTWWGKILSHSIPCISLAWTLITVSHLFSLFLFHPE